MPRNNYSAWVLHILVNLMRRSSEEDSYCDFFPKHFKCQGQRSTQRKWMSRFDSGDFDHNEEITVYLA